MKTIFFALALIAGLNAFSAVPQPATEKTYTFQFKAIKLPIVKKAHSKNEAFKLAARECYTKLTGGKYPGEEKGLDIIDICANPKM
jgi:hypothetical protein